MTQVLVEIEGLNSYANFGWIDIVYDTNMYPVLLGIDWAIDNQTIINFKKRILTFKDEKIRLTTPVTERNFLWLGVYHNRQLDLKNQSLPNM